MYLKRKKDIMTNRGNQNYSYSLGTGIMYKTDIMYKKRTFEYDELYAF